MVEWTFVLRVYHFWMRNKPILKYAQFRPILNHFPLSTGQIFKLISPHENIINFFQLKYISILHIKRHQKITQAKVFENFTSRQHALLHKALLLWHCLCDSLFGFTRWAQSIIAIIIFHHISLIFVKYFFYISALTLFLWHPLQIHSGSC